MTILLEFAVKYLYTLFDEYKFVIKESKNTGNRFSGSSIIIASNDIEIFLAIERDEITILFRSLFDIKNNNWYSIEVVMDFLGHKNCLGVMSDYNSSLLKDELKQIVLCFGEKQYVETLRKLDEIERKKAKHS